MEILSQTTSFQQDCRLKEKRTNHRKVTRRSQLILKLITGCAQASFQSIEMKNTTAYTSKR